MVLIESLKITEQVATNCEMLMDSGHRIYYVAPLKYSTIPKDIEQCDNLNIIHRKASSSGKSILI